MFSRVLALAFSLITLSSPVNHPAVVGYQELSESSEAKNRVVPCLVGHTSPPIGFWTWPADTQVNLYLREPDFSASDLFAVELAVKNWDATATENGSNVRFTFHGLTREMRNAQGEITIVRKAIFDKKQRHLALLEAHSRHQDGLIDYALILVDPSVRKSGLLTNVVAHEIGHSLGLMDCHKCDSRSTTMSLIKTGDDSNRMEGPTHCDKREVRAAYAGVKSRTPLIADAK